MTSPSDVARNAAAVRTLAARLEREGWTGDAIAAAEEFAAILARAGWRPLDPTPPLRGPVSTVEGRKAARRLFEQTRREKEQTQ